MKFALDTLKGVIHGGRDERIYALLTFGLWFVAGAFLASTAQYYFAPVETAAAPLLGGTLLAIAAGLTKFS